MKPICLTNSSTPVFVISSNNIQYINGTWLTRFHSWFFPNSSYQFSPIARPKMLALVQQHFPKSATHRVHTEWLSGVHSIMKENQPRLVRAEGGGWCTPTPFHYIHHHVQSCSVCSSWEGRYTHRVHRVVTSAFWRTFSHEGKISMGWWGWGCTPTPLLLHLPSPVKLQCTLQLSGQIHWPCFISCKDMYSVDTLPLFYLYPYVLCATTLWI
jgi:hypothetical protein